MRLTKPLHISEVEEFCEDPHDGGMVGSISGLHPHDYCLMCGYLIAGPRLYMEIHDEKGWNWDLPQIPDEQSYVCMKCANQFRAYHKLYNQPRMSSEIELHH